ncbi:MAG: hypothetical protein COS36_01505 [Candidatus Altarchaeum sp. CG03_land_8_20_14_0_80_32_618]|nr:MAG: hypothetical protein AUK59_07435 [Candidatus Altarchaeum sp. CG2_30_32_3053]PIV28646.1 MAG: hypothetical protein COS36_01505 [Candidatus Altarchaeum sp. CG03_land_8_20_14_0_80_32_618]PJC14516.1 MAG: hypothetical protein CO063_02640 [Candidatus Altarchaeum sp. CG_4_9_14_0_8_um_filter_32_206]
MKIFDFEYNVGGILKPKDLCVKNYSSKDVTIKKFPDGEIYVRVIPPVENENCIVVKSIYNNEELIKTLLTLNALKKGGAKKIYLVAPYLIYIRQDKIFKKGECLSAEFVLNEIKNYADEIFLVNPHIPFNFYEYTEYKGIKFYGIDVSYEIAKYFMARDPKVMAPYCSINLTDPKVISPDDGAINLAKRYSEILTCEWNYLNKIRISPTRVIIENKDLKTKRFI